MSTTPTPQTDAQPYGTPAERQAAKHFIDYDTRYGRTSDYCYCLNTRGMSHSEHDGGLFPWVGPQGQIHGRGVDPGTFEEPLDPPLADGESVEEYLERRTATAVAERVIDALDEYMAEREEERQRESTRLWGNPGSHVPSAAPTRDGRIEAIRKAIQGA